ncbi:hypothetical protein BHE90_008180 [Fusarium euwallaceae]|uniref:Uncharacterized protein n=1 Tax=Fusarium euwallaceae TaxID=1147111 RepID=A0A430LNR3_9HYPO|nr:hypothetical protein BHE90_008180 [Fusarium euwallaceae]
MAQDGQVPARVCTSPSEATLRKEGTGTCQPTSNVNSQTSNTTASIPNTRLQRSIHFARLPTTYRSYNISLRPINNITYLLIKTLAPLSCALRSLQPSHRI